MSTEHGYHGNTENHLARLRRIEGQVDDVQVDLAAGGVSTVTVTGVVPPEMVRRAIEATGYTVLY